MEQALFCGWSKWSTRLIGQLGRFLSRILLKAPNKLRTISASIISLVPPLTCSFLSLTSCPLADQFQLPFSPLASLCAELQQDTKYIVCQRKNKQERDYISIKILAALIVIDTAEILSALRANSRTRAWICTRARTMHGVSFSRGCLLRSNNTSTYQEGLMLPLLGPLETPLSPCFAMKVYQSSDKLWNTAALSCVTKAAASTYAYWDTVM